MALMAFEMGGPSQVVEAGALLMSGLFGFYLMLWFWRGRASVSEVFEAKMTADSHSYAASTPFEHHEHSSPTLSSPPKYLGPGEVITGKSIADFL